VEGTDPVLVRLACVRCGIHSNAVADGRPVQGCANCGYWQFEAVPPSAGDQALGLTAAPPIDLPRPSTVARRAPEAKSRMAKLALGLWRHAS
jgi:predicted  nucleic acid-binding Zn-ribbon protein